MRLSISNTAYKFFKCKLLSCDIKGSGVTHPQLFEFRAGWRPDSASDPTLWPCLMASLTRMCTVSDGFTDQDVRDQSADYAGHRLQSDGLGAGGDSPRQTRRDETGAASVLVSPEPMPLR